MLPKTGSNGKRVYAKYIYVIRNPKDVVTSFFHHLTNQQEGSFEGTFSEFLTEFLEGTLPFGKWTDHIKSFLGYSDAGLNILLLRYADMVADLRPSVDKIVQYCELDLTPAEIDELMPSFGFKAMKKNKDLFQPISVGWKKGYGRYLFNNII